MNKLLHIPNLKRLTTFGLSLVFASLVGYAQSNKTQAVEIDYNRFTKIDMSTAVMTNPSSIPHASEASLTLGMSGNVFTLLNSKNNAIHYNQDLNTLVYIRRRETSGPSYGDIAIDFSTDGGSSWFVDSLVLANQIDVPGNNGNRYPNVTLLNPSGNTDPSSALAVGVGPSLANNNEGENDWARTFRGSIRLDSTLGHLQYTANDSMAVNTNLPPTPNDFFGGAGLYANTDSTVFSVGSSINIGSAASGRDSLSNLNFYIWKGTMHSGSDTLDWEIVTKISPPIIDPYQNSSGEWFRNGGGAPLLAFNPTGRIGYFVHLSRVKTSVETENNKKFFVARTTDYGASWTTLGAIKLESNPLINSTIGGTSGDENLKQADPDPEFAIAVDIKDSLHIFCDIAGQFSTKTDSLNFVYSNPSQHSFFVINLLDNPQQFSAWFIDSADVSDYEYDANQRTSHTERFSISRTEDGNKLFYVWSDSDPNLALSVDNVPQNSSPQAIAVARDVSTGKWARSKILTFDTDADEIFFYGTVSDITIVNTNTDNQPKYEIPIGHLEIGGSSTDFATHKYLNDLGFNEADFTENEPYTNAFLGLNSANKLSTKVDIFPNPNSGNFSLKIGDVGNYTVEVIDLLGRTIYSQQVNNNNSLVVSLENPSLTSGIYFLKLSNTKGVITKKFIINNPF